MPASLGPVRAICFDASETIIAWNTAFEASLKEAIREWVGRWGDEKEAARLLNDAMRTYRKSRRSGNGKQTSIRAALKLLPIDEDERTIARIVNQARELTPVKAAFVDGAEDTLQALSSAYRLAIVTNLSAADAKTVWRRLKLHRYIEEKHIFAAQGDVRKPRKAMFQAAAAQLGVPPQHCLMVGDSYKQDIGGAVRSGWKAVWIHKKTRRPAVKQAFGGRRIYIVPSITMLPRLLHPKPTPKPE